MGKPQRNSKKYRTPTTCWVIRVSAVSGRRQGRATRDMTISEGKGPIGIRGANKSSMQTKISTALDHTKTAGTNIMLMARIHMAIRELREEMADLTNKRRSRSITRERRLTGMLEVMNTLSTLQATCTTPRNSSKEPKKNT